jgi:hypothetical protein
MSLVQINTKYKLLNDSIINFNYNNHK